MFIKLNNLNSINNKFYLKLLLLLFFSFQQLLSIRFFFSSKYIIYDPFYSWTLYVFFSSIIFWLFLNSKFIIEFFTHKFFFFIIIFILFLFFLKMYPIADSMKNSNLGIDQDDCFLVFIENFKNNEFLYSRTYLGNPCSTGLLEFVFYFPVIFWNDYFSIVPVIALVIFYFLLSKEVSNNAAVFFTLIQLCNIIFIEMGVAGSDFLLIGVSYIASLRLSHMGFKYNNKTYLILSFLFFIFFYGSRSVFLLLIPFNFYLMWLKFNSRILILFIPVILITFLSYGIPSFINFEMFTPFHLFGKVYFLFYQAKYFILIFLGLMVFFLAKYRTTIQNFLLKNDSLLLPQVMLITAPLTLVVLTSFFSTINLGSWEELNYTLLFIPSIFYLLAKNFEKKSFFTF